MTKKITSYLIAGIIGALVLFFVGGPNVEKAEKLTERASTLNESANKHLLKAIDQETKYMVNRGIISAKDREISDLKAKLNQALPEDELGTLKAIIIQQDSAIALRDNQIETLRIQNAELNQALLAQRRAYEVQLDATKAYAEAMSSAQWKSGIKGVIIGLAVGFTAGK